MCQDRSGTARQNRVQPGADRRIGRMSRKIGENACRIAKMGLDMFTPHRVERSDGKDDRLRDANLGQVGERLCEHGLAPEDPILRQVQQMCH